VKWCGNAKEEGEGCGGRFQLIDELGGEGFLVEVRPTTKIFSKVSLEKKTQRTT